MNYEENRLNTFAGWPSSAEIEPIRVAKAGFFFTGRGVEVQCFSCGGKISEWSHGDRAMARHRRLDPNCPFVRDPSSSGNVAFVLGESGSTGDSSVTDGQSPSMPSTDQTESGLLDTRPMLNSDDEIYRNDALRLLSYINWPVRFISRESLASAGFYHAGGGRVRCAWCGGELCGGWQVGDLPIDEHRRHFPRCEYARRAAEMAPLAEPGGAPMDAVRERGAPTADSPQTEADATPQSETVEHNWRVLENVPWRGLGVVGCGSDGARYPGRASVASRMATFTEWPISLRQTPQMLAEAGFYYTGSDDQVMCFYCGGGLGRWEPADAPWSEHARWFPECGYVMLVKGRDFIESCKHAGNVQTNTNNNNNAPRSTTSSRVQFPVTDAQLEREMESPTALTALGTGLGAARVRTAIRRRLLNTGSGFSSSEALIDAALNEQLNEECWSARPTRQLERDTLAETLRTLRAAAADTLNNVRSPPAPRAPVVRTSSPPLAVTPPPANQKPAPSHKPALGQSQSSPKRPVSLEEENRQLKEARLCKVCMDSEVCVVFLPCGHLVSCGACGASLASCPLCRTAVQAFVRAYLA